MAPRPYWKGYLKLSLVSCPIALYPAVDASERISFRQVNRATGNRLRQQLVDTVTGEAIESHNKARGYEVCESQFVVVEDQELEQARAEARAHPFGAAPAARSKEEAQPAPERKREELKRPVAEPAIVAPPRPRLENTRTIDIERFIPRSQIDARYHHTPYYIAPRDLIGQEAFAVIRDAISHKGVVALGHIVLSNRERPIILEPIGLGLCGITLRYLHEIRGEAEYFADIPQMQLPAQMVGLAEHIVETKLADFDTALLEDRYRTALVSMLREKKAEVAPPARPAMPSRKNVIDLMDMLQRSLGAERAASDTTVQKSRPRRAAAAASKSDSSRRSKVRGRSSSRE
jgi:DNA end-binding protein Ku